MAPMHLLPQLLAGVRLHSSATLFFSPARSPDSPSLHSSSPLRRAGGSADDGLPPAPQEHISPKISKQMAHAFMQMDPTPSGVDNPVHALRCAQVSALGGSVGLQIAACNTVLGTMVGDHEQEEFAQSMLLWMADHEDEMQQVSISASPSVRAHRGPLVPSLWELIVEEPDNSSLR